jgi:DNA-binding response OmpR family regulator
LPLQGQWILIAEDEAMIGLDLQDAFEAAGAHVALSFSLEQAMALLDKRRWAGAVLDYALCEKDCTPLCEWFLARQIPFLICSGYESVSMPCSRGIRLVKPATAEEVVHTMTVLVA